MMMMMMMVMEVGMMMMMMAMMMMMIQEVLRTRTCTCGTSELALGILAFRHVGGLRRGGCQSAFLLLQVGRHAHLNLLIIVSHDLRDRPGVLLHHTNFRGRVRGRARVRRVGTGLALDADICSADPM